MKKYLTLLIFYVFSITIFANSSIDKIRVNKRPSQLVFDISGVKPKYKSNYDEYNRLLFIEVEKTSINKSLEKVKISSKDIENFNIVDYGDKTGFFISLKKGAGHRVHMLSNPTRLVVEMKSTVHSTKEFTIVIDAGHGGEDTGAIGFGKYNEKDITLSVAKRLSKKLSKDFKIVMTRDTDKFVKLSKRSQIGNNAKADLFVSLHANAAKSTTANGVEIFYFSKKSSPYAEKIANYENSFGEKYGEKTTDIAQIMGELSYNKNMDEAIKLAEPMNTSLAKKLKMSNRGIHGANFAVLRGFNGPGILVELGFITNKTDLRKILRKSNHDAMAEEIAKKIREYFN